MHLIGESFTRLQPGIDLSDAVLQATRAQPCVLDTPPSAVADVHWPELVNAWQDQILRALSSPTQVEQRKGQRRVQVLGQVIFDIEIATGQVAAYRWRRDSGERLVGLDRLLDALVIAQGVPFQSLWLDAWRGEALNALYRRYPDQRGRCRHYTAWVAEQLEETFWGLGTQEIVRRHIAEALALDPQVLDVAAGIQLTSWARTPVRIQDYNHVQHHRDRYLSLQREAPQLTTLYALLADELDDDQDGSPGVPDEVTLRMKGLLQRQGIRPAMWRLICREGTGWMKPPLAFFDLEVQALSFAAIDLLTMAQAFGTHALAPDWLLHAFMQLGGTPNRRRYAYAHRLDDLFPLCARMGHLLTQADGDTLALLQERAADIFNWGSDHLMDLPARALRHISVQGLLRQVDALAAKEALALDDTEVWCIPYRIRLRGKQFQAVVLDSPLAVWQEGRAMHHCAARYIQRCASGVMLMVSLRDSAQARPEATLAFDMTGRGVRLIQVSGFANRQVEPAVHLAALRCLRQLKLQKRALAKARRLAPQEAANDVLRLAA